MQRKSEAGPLGGAGGAGTGVTGNHDVIVPHGPRRTSSLLTHLPKDAARTGNLTYSLTPDDLLRDLRFLDDEALQVRIDYAEHYAFLAAECGVDFSAPWLAGEQAIAEVARQILAERAARRYRFEPGRLEISRELLDTIKARIDLREVIAQRVELRPWGRALMGKCPLHDDRVPSLAVYGDNRWHCFGCKTSGDVFTWLQLTENLSFREAAKRAAVMAGLAPSHE